MIDLGDHAEGVLLPVRAKPGARKNGVQGERDGALVVAVNAPPEDGRANAVLVEVLHDELGLKRSRIELVSGHKGRDKRFLLRGVTRAEVAAMLAEWDAGSDPVSPRRGAGRALIAPRAPRRG